MSETPLVTRDAWTDGETWLRERSGPRPKGLARIEVTVWHRIGSIDSGWQRLRTACGFGPRGGFVWPFGGGRWEIARPGDYGGLPGEVCVRCANRPRPVQNPEAEVLVEDVPDIDALASLVAEYLIERHESKATGATEEPRP